MFINARVPQNSFLACCQAENSADDSNSEDLTDSDADDSDTEMMQLAAVMVRRFNKMAYKQFLKEIQTLTKRVSEAEGKEGKSEKVDKSKIKCYNYGQKGHFESECNKGKADKSQANITKKKHWADTSGTEDEVISALMENVESNSEVINMKVPHSTFAFDTHDIVELRIFLINMHVSYRDQLLENERINSESLYLKKRYIEVLFYLV